MIRPHRLALTTDHYFLKGIVEKRLWPGFFNRSREVELLLPE